MQRGNEDGPLDRELESTVRHKVVQHIGDAKLLPEPAKQQRPTNALSRNGEGAVLVLLARFDEQNLVAELGAGGGQGGESARTHELVGTPKSGDDRLAHGPINPFVFDHLHISAFAGLLDAEEHGTLLRDTTKYDSHSEIKRKIK